MKWAVEEITQPEVEPVSLEETKAHLRVDGSDEDALISALIVAARQWAENEIGYVTVQRQLRLLLDGWPASGVDTITLPRSRLISIDSVEYVDRDGATQTWANTNYVADTASVEGRLLRAPGVAWPETRAQRQAVRITYTAGWPDDGASPPDYAANVPQAIKQAILLMVGHWYEHREAVNIGNIVTPLEFAAKALLAPYRRMYL